MKRRKDAPFQFVFALTVLLLTPIVTSTMPRRKHVKVGEEGGSAVVWRDPGDVSTLNLFYGSGGKDHAPDMNGTFTFVKEDMNGTNPKFDIRDENGVEWKVKLGPEPQSETAATRLLWAAGYFTDDDYFLDTLKVHGIPRLKRGEHLISKDGTVHHARLERHNKNVKKLGTWNWFNNRCGSSTEFNGLKIMMAFVNNWDLKAVNNTLEETDGERRCAVTDLGATFGSTGSTLTRSRSVERDYARSQFVQKVRPEYVDFVMHSRPFVLTIFDFPNYFSRARMERIPKHIPIADAKWLGHRLTPLTVGQIHDCFRSAGYSPDEVDGYTKAVQRRIAELNAL